jgi:hypothetical protein
LPHLFMSITTVFFFFFFSSSSSRFIYFLDIKI